MWGHSRSLTKRNIRFCARDFFASWVATLNSWVRSAWLEDESTERARRADSAESTSLLNSFRSFTMKRRKLGECNQIKVPSITKWPWETRDNYLFQKVCPDGINGLFVPKLRRNNVIEQSIHTHFRYPIIKMPFKISIWLLDWKAPNSVNRCNFI